jgi:transaldolase
MTDHSTFLSQCTCVDLDALDSTVPSLFPNTQFCDCTSNQAIALGQLQAPSAVPLFKRVEELIKGDKPVRAFCTDHATTLDTAADILTILLQAEILPQLQDEGRVHIQTSPKCAGDAALMVAQGQRIVKLAQHLCGIPKDRICIKIPSTFAGLEACRILEQHGIACLATILFTEHQARLAHNAGCTYIAPYINELRVHFLAGYRDPMPNFSMVQRIHTLYAELASKTMILPASLTSVEEVARLRGIEHITISPALLLLLSQTPVEEGAQPVYQMWDRSVEAKKATVPEQQEADGRGFPSDHDIDPAAEHARKFEEAMQIFIKAEDDIAKLIEANMQLQ